MTKPLRQNSRQLSFLKYNTHYLFEILMCDSGFNVLSFRRQPDVSEVYIVSIFRVEEQAERETNRNGWRAALFNLGRSDEVERDGHGM
jgi:hypothetical protein